MFEFVRFVNNVPVSLRLLQLTRWHFIGRERELELLSDSYERAKAGRGQAVSIIADAGVGNYRKGGETCVFIITKHSTR